jgi:hypothetical protein
MPFFLHVGARPVLQFLLAHPSPKFFPQLPVPPFLIKMISFRVGKAYAFNGTDWEREEIPYGSKDTGPTGVFHGRLLDRWLDD